MFGLPEPTIRLPRSYFRRRPDIAAVLIFGSRATGRHHRGSDIDLAIVGTTDEDRSGQVKAELDDLPTPYLFDVVDYDRLIDAGQIKTPADPSFFFNNSFAKDYVNFDPKTIADSAKAAK